MQRKKSRFLLFIFSFVPGAGEMYLGFMKMGVSLMLGFFLLAGIVGVTNLGILAAFPVVMYCYSFFHANHLGTMDDMSFRAVQDRFLFGLDNVDDFNKVKGMVSGKYRKAIAVCLIFVGVVMLWQAAFNLLCDIFGWDNEYLSRLYYFVRDDVPRFIIAFVIIWCGIALIRGKKAEILREEQDVFANPHRPGGTDVYEGTYGTGNRDMQSGMRQPGNGNMPTDAYRHEDGKMPAEAYQPDNREVPAASYRAENQVIYVEPGCGEDKTDR